MPVVSEIGEAADAPASASAMCKRQSVRFGLVAVTTSRRPSALAANDVYLSGPDVRRWGIRRSRFML